MSLSRLLLEDEEMHRCMNGRLVKTSSPLCIRDLNARIADAIDSRDLCKSRTDSRLHYNGLLRILRRELRKSTKLQQANT